MRKVCLGCREVECLCDEYDAKWGPMKEKKGKSTKSARRVPLDDNRRRKENVADSRRRKERERDGFNEDFE